MTPGRLRLLRLREQTEAIEETMVSERARFLALERREPVRAVVAFNLFQTPEPLAARMAGLLGCLDGHRVLEPSAGLGRLYRALRARSSAQITLVENAADCARELYTTTEGDPAAQLIQADFLTYRPDCLFDRVLMNPPFKMGLDIKHTMHALSMLAPGGRLVGLCYNGSKQNTKLRPVVNTWEVLPHGTFRESGTMADVALFTIEKPQ